MSHLPNGGAMPPWGSSPTSSQTTMPTTTSTAIPAHISVPHPSVMQQQQQHYATGGAYYASPQQQQQGMYPPQPQGFVSPEQQQGFPPPHQQAAGMPQQQQQYAHHPPQQQPQQPYPPQPHPQNYQQQPPPQQQQQSLYPPRPSVIQQRQASANSCNSNPHNDNDIARTTQERKLQLLQEQISVDRELFAREKKEWKKKLRLAKSKLQESHKAHKISQKKRSLEWAALQHQAETNLKERIASVEQQSHEKIAKVKAQIEAQEIKFRKERNTLETNVSELTQDLQSAQSQLRQQKQQVPVETTTDAKQQAETIERLTKELEDQTHQITSLEMQLLEAERNSMVDLGNSMTSQLDLCGNCASTERRLADAQLQIDTLTNRQFILDNKLTNERLNYEKLQIKYNAILVEHEECANANEKRLALSATVKKLQDQMVEYQMAVEKSDEQVEELSSQKKTVEAELTKVRTVLNETQAKKQVLHETVTSTQQKLAALQKLHATKKVADDETNDDDDEDDLSLALERIKVYEKEWTTHPEYAGLYTGDWRADAPDGSGTLRLDDGAVYDGQWKGGKPHGRGVWASIDGDLYHGEWRNGRKHGSLVEVTADGRVYRGSYKDDLMDGTGILTWPFGAYYFGQFVADKRTGQGVYFYADGDRKYEGDYVDDRPHGYGVMTKTADGSILYDGNWERGEFLGGVDQPSSDNPIVDPPRGTDSFDDDVAGDLDEEDEEEVDFDDESNDD